MVQSKMWKRFATFAFAFMLVFTSVAVPCNSVEAASKTAVKSVSLKVGKKNVAKKTYKMYSGDKATLKVTVSPSAAKKSVKFSSSKKTVAAVSSKGVITAKKSGTAKISVKVTGKNKKTKTTYVNVKVSYVKLTLNKKTASVNVGKTVTLKATVSPKKTVKWASSNKKVATVTTKGVVKGVKAGTATITASVGNKKATCKVTVKKAATPAPTVVNVTSVSLNQTSIAMEEGKTYQLKATVSPSNATDKTVAWKSSNENAVTVSANGLITAKAAGTAAITATAGGKTATCNVTVTAKAVPEVAVTEVVATADKYEVNVGEVIQITASVRPENATKKELTYSSSNEAVATVNPAGAVIGVSEGTAVITVKSANGKTAQITVTVKGKPVLEDGITLEVTNPFKGNDGKVVDENTVLASKFMNVRARVIKDHQPLADTNVTLRMARSDDNGGVSGYEIKNDSVRTDKDGYAVFTIGAKDPDVTPAQSYTVTATDASSNISKDITVKFAQVYLGSLEVKNEYDDTLPRLVPSTNDKYAGRTRRGSVVFTKSVNSDVDNEEYLTSQQVSTKSKNHSVYFSATPELYIPAAAGTTERGDWSVKFPNDKATGKSGPCSIYNDATNVTTTTQVESVPGGLQYLTLIFDKINISKFTEIHAQLYYRNENGSMGLPAGDPIRVTSESNSGLIGSKKPSVQVPADKLVTGGYLVVSLVSEGQVEVAHEGYILSEITGPWAAGVAQDEGFKELNDAVVWENVSQKVHVEQKGTLSNVAEYLSDEDYEEFVEGKGVTSTYTVPTFPYAGNAIITIKDGNGNASYFAYPSVRSEGNVNVIADPDSDPDGRKAFLISEDEANKLVGTIETKGNTAIVNSSETGTTALKATIKVDELSDRELNALQGGELYTSVQWAPVPAGTDTVVRDTTPNYYAIEGQTVTITAQLSDENGNKKTDAGESITFKDGHGNVLTAQGDRIGGTAAGDDDRDATITDFKDGGKTDSHGLVTLVLSGNSTAFVKGLTAISTNGYKVSLAIGTNAGAQNISKVNIRWVDLGLSFTPEVGGSEKRAMENQNTNTGITSTSAVGKDWYIGYRPIAGVYGDIVGESHDVKIDVTNIPVSYALADGSVGTLTQANNVATLKSTQVGNSKLVGKIDSAKLDTSKVAFAIPSVDENGKVVKTNYPNIGSGNSEMIDNTSLTHTMQWVRSGEKAEILTPDGNVVNSAKGTTVYVKVTDTYGNEINDATVSYTATGAVVDSGSAVNKTKGIYAITLGSATTFISKDAEKACNISVKVNNGISVNKIVRYHNYDVDGQLAITNARAIGAKEIEVTFNNNISTANDFAKVCLEMFKVVDDTNHLEYKVTAIKQDSDHKNILTLTLEKALEAPKVAHKVVVGAATPHKNAVAYHLLDEFAQTFASESVEHAITMLTTE